MIVFIIIVSLIELNLSPCNPRIYYFSPPSAIENTFPGIIQLFKQTKKNLTNIFATKKYGII